MLLQTSDWFCFMIWNHIIFVEVRDSVMWFDFTGKIQKIPLAEAIQKDTMVAPSSGYTIVQFRADNPGWWFFHCHYDVYLAVSQFRIIIPVLS